jgi:hypothetical protein
MAECWWRLLWGDSLTARKLPSWLKRKMRMSTQLPRILDLPHESLLVAMDSDLGRLWREFRSLTWRSGSATDFKSGW